MKKAKLILAACLGITAVVVITPMLAEAEEGAPLVMEMGTITGSEGVRMQLVRASDHNVEFDSFFDVAGGEFKPNSTYQHTREQNVEYYLQVFDYNPPFECRLENGTQPEHIDVATSKVLLSVNLGASSADSSCTLSYPPLAESLNIIVNPGDGPNTKIRVYEDDVFMQEIADITRNRSYVYHRINHDANVTLQVFDTTQPWCNEAGNPAEGGTKILPADSTIYLTIASDNTSCAISQNGAKVPVEIANCGDLSRINDPYGSYILTQDIDCYGVNFEPLFAANNGHFFGMLDGNHKTIYNLTMNHGSSSTKHLSVGLFREINGGAHIKDITFRNPTINTIAQAPRGVIAGQAWDAILENITITGGLNIDGTTNGSAGGSPSSTGAIVGIASGSQLKNIKVNGDNGTSNKAQVKLRKNAFTGGLVGVAKNGTTISNSYVRDLYLHTASCNNGSDAGIADCAAGGLVGLIPSDEQYNTSGKAVTIDKSYAAGQVDINVNAGGLVGRIKSFVKASISNSHSNVIVGQSSGEGVGGLIGLVDQQSGYNTITLTNNYAVGQVVNSTGEGGRGLVGLEKGGPSYSVRIIGASNYYNTETTKKGTNDSGVSLSVGAGKTTAEMKQKATYSNWDFNTIWKITENSSYPTLINNP